MWQQRSQTWCHFAPGRKGAGKKVESPSLPFHVHWSSEHIPARHHREMVISHNEKTEPQDSLSLQGVWKRWNKQKKRAHEVTIIRFVTMRPWCWWESRSLVMTQTSTCVCPSDPKQSSLLKTGGTLLQLCNTVSIYGPDRKLCHKKRLKAQRTTD